MLFSPESRLDGFSDEDSATTSHVSMACRSREPRHRVYTCMESVYVYGMSRYLSSAYFRQIGSIVGLFSSETSGGKRCPSVDPISLSPQPNAVRSRQIRPCERNDGQKAEN